MILNYNRFHATAALRLPLVLPARSTPHTTRVRPLRPGERDLRESERSARARAASLTSNRTLRVQSFSLCSAGASAIFYHTMCKANEKNAFYKWAHEANGSLRGQALSPHLPLD